MEKITVNICGRNYYLRADESSDRIVNLGKTLEDLINEYKSALKNKSEEEILTLVALNVLDDADKLKTNLINEKDALEKKVAEIEIKMYEQRKEDQSILNENIVSAESELSQIASVKDEENEKLHSKLQEYEQAFEKLMTDRDEEIKKLTETFSSAKSELERIATIKDNDNNKLRNTLNSYETSFDMYVKTKEDELVNLEKRIEEANLEIENLQQRLAAVTDDGQISIC